MATMIKQNQGQMKSCGRAGGSAGKVNDGFDAPRAEGGVLILMVQCHDCKHESKRDTEEPCKRCFPKESQYEPKMFC
jgi:hypothetical protein